MQHYVIKFVSDMRQVSVFLRVLRLSSCFARMNFSEQSHIKGDAMRSPSFRAKQINDNMFIEDLVMCRQ